MTRGQFRTRCPIATFTFLSALLVAAPARAALERVGPIQPANGYPAW